MQGGLFVTVYSFRREEGRGGWVARVNLFYRINFLPQSDHVKNTEPHHHQPMKNSPKPTGHRLSTQYDTDDLMHLHLDHPPPKSPHHPHAASFMFFTTSSPFCKPLWFQFECKDQPVEVVAAKEKDSSALWPSLTNKLQRVYCQKKKEKLWGTRISGTLLRHLMNTCSLKKAYREALFVPPSSGSDLAVSRLFQYLSFTEKWASISW